MLFLILSSTIFNYQKSPTDNNDDIKVEITAS